MSFVKWRVMINRSLIAPSHCHLPISLSSRPPSRFCVSSSSRPCYLSSRLPSCPVVLLLRLVSLRRRSVPIRAVIVSVIYPFIISSLPFPIAPPILPHRLIASSYPAALSISSSPSPLPDGKIELTKTARSFRHSHQSNRIPRREATGKEARRHEMRKTNRPPPCP